MKLLRLDLIAFGPFTGRSLELSERVGAGAGTLQIILGSNEAGKSTSLRALEGLLFGIDARSPDAHLHPYGELRVGGLIANQRGEVLDVVRRKGQKSTLRDRAGEPIDEARLKKMLHGVDADAFRALYGLNHETLRLGADALEKAQGKVGESLFDAGLGGLGVGQAIVDLAEEADQLFTPQARKKPLNESIRALIEAQKEVRTEATNPDAFSKQERGIDDARSEARDAEAERRALLVEQARLRRIVRVGPGLSKRRALLERRALLGDVTLLAESAGAERELALEGRAESRAKLERIEREVARLSEATAAIDAPRNLLDASDDVDGLKERASLAQAAIEERPTVVRDLDDAERRLAVIAARVGASVGLPDARLAARIGQIALERESSSQRMREVASRLGELDVEKTRLATELERLPSMLDFDDLALAVDEGATVAALPGQLARDEAEIEVLRARLDAEIAALGLFPGTAAELARSKVPPVERLIVAEREGRERAERQRAAFANLSSAERKTRERKREIDALLRAGTVPAESELGSARAARDALVLELASGGRFPEASVFEALAQLVREADSLADRLRREASRVERHAQLASALDEASRASDDLRHEVTTLAELEVVEEAKWREAWRDSRIDPLAPTEMRAWLERRRALVDLWLDREAKIERLNASRARVAEVGSGLALTMRRHGDESSSGEPSASRPLGRDDGLAGLLAAARSMLTANERVIAKREASTVQLRETDTKLARLERERAELTVLHDASFDAWARAMETLGLEPSASTGEASARASDLVELVRAKEDAQRVRSVLARLDGREAELLRQLAIVTRRCPELEGGEIASLAATPRAHAIAKRLAEAREGELTRASLCTQMAALTASAIDERGRLARADAKMAELERAAFVSESELPRAEARSLEASVLDREIDHVEQELRAHTGGATFAELSDELDLTSEIDVSARLDELAEQIEASESRRDRAHHSVGGLEQGLRKLEREAKAADLAVLAESHLARAATLLRRYVVARLSKEVLEREVERYRASHQGPILQRAEELFRRLTGGRYESLRVVLGADEKPELRCIREGSEVEIGGLSDGTRDQLFLALRLATVERHAAEGEPMPLVLDDVFVHFDDERTRAALEVLAELSRVVQVLLFTHHARVVELAEREPRIEFALNRL